jgi:hypothetical protein
MTPEQLTQLLDELGKRLGPGGAHVFELAVRQAIITSTMQLAAAGVLVAIAVTVLAVVWRFLHRDTSKLERWSSSDDEGVAAVGIVVALFVIVIAVFGAVNSIPTLLNPEYAALRDLLSQVKP